LQVFTVKIQSIWYLARLHVFTRVTMKITVFWNATLCCSAYIYIHTLVRPC